MIYTTCTSEDEAKQISKILLDENLIACSNIIPKILSIFEWDSKISSQSECALLLKTIEENFDGISNLIKENHSYEMPCIFSFPVKNIESDFGDWVKKITNKQV
jgi:periplasmic divalent cation tolerance protein